MLTGFIEIIGRHTAILLTAVLLWTGCPTSAWAQEAPIVIGLLPEMNVFKQQQRYASLADHLSKAVGRPVQFTMLSRYGNVVQRFKEQKVDGAFLGSFTGALCVIQLGAEPLARPVNMDDTSTYKGYVFARKDSGIKTAADMKNKVLVLVERATTAGYVFPMAYLRQAGIADPKTYFKEMYFAGSHDATIDAVLNGKADVGACKNTIYDMIRQQDQRVEAELSILATSAPVPSNGLCVRGNLDANLKQQLKKALLELDRTPEGLKILEKLNAKRFVETKREDYQPVIELAKDAGLNLEEYQYQNQ